MAAESPKKQSQNKPNQTQFPKSQNEYKLNYNKGLQKKDDFTVRKNKPNSNPISERPKMNVNLYVIEDYENETAFRLQKNKPNSNPISNVTRQSKGCLTSKTEVSLPSSVLGLLSSVLRLALISANRLLLFPGASLRCS